MKGAPVAGDSVRRMAQELLHRGPDDQGVETMGAVGLGHTRLSIIDQAGGHQPMSFGNDYWITFNGEIFNHVELREELQAKGFRFSTASDTEVLLASYVAWGDDCVHHLNGQWGAAIWDGPRSRLLLTRDPMGIRPLYYYVDQRGGRSRLLFASEIKALFADPEVERQIDVRGLDQVFTFWHTIAPRTIFKGVHELPAGHHLVVERGELHTRPYFELDYGKSDLDANESRLAEELLAEIVESARLRLLRSDVPVGAYLSGGLDSAVIAGTVRRFSETPLRTFSVTFEDAEFDESAFQKKVIDYLGVDHSSVACSKADICAAFPKVVRHTEQPLMRTAPAPLFLLSREVHDRGYKVVLTGEGSDELLGGYDIFKEAKIRRFWAQQPASTMRPRLLRKLYPYLPGMQAQSEAYLKAFFFVRDEDLSSPFFSHLPRWEMTSKAKLFFSPEVRQELEGFSATDELRRALPEGFGRWHAFHQAQYLEARYLMPGYILSSQGDRMAMAHAVEGRFPFLDRRVVELSTRIHPRLKMRALDEKALLKRAAGDLVPSFLHERPKQPYRAPDSESFFDAEAGTSRMAWVEELLSESRIAQAGLFAPSAVATLTKKAKRGKVVGTRDGMAIVAILSTMLVVEQLVNRQNMDTDS